MKFRKKPVVIEATRWFNNGDHPLDGNETFVDSSGATQLCEGRVVRYYRNPNVPGESVCTKCGKTMHEHGWIDTREGDHIVCFGDWIITGIAGENYPCKPDIFSLTYEKVEDDE